LISVKHVNIKELKDKFNCLFTILDEFLVKINMLKKKWKKLIQFLIFLEEM